MKSYYPYWLKLDKRNLCCLWVTEEFDQVYLNDQQQLPAFTTEESLKAHFHDISIAVEESMAVPLDLDKVQAFCKKPTVGRVNCKVFLNAWNIFGDLYSAINQRNMDIEDKGHLDVYNKLFWGSNLPVMTPVGEKFIPSWTDEELKELSDVLSSGLADFKSRVVVAG